MCQLDHSRRRGQRDRLQVRFAALDRRGRDLADHDGADAPPVQPEAHHGQSIGVGADRKLALVAVSLGRAYSYVS
jgi:hypothetical protein